MIRCKTKIAKVFKGLGCLFTTLALWCFVCQFSLCIGIVMMQQNRQNSPSFCHCRPLGMSFQLPVWYPDNTQRLLSMQISSKCRVPLRNVTVAFFLEIVMRGYNSRHIVILMSVSLMIREFIKTMLMYPLLSGSLEWRPSRWRFVSYYFSGWRSRFGSYDIKYTSQGAVLN